MSAISSPSFCRTYSTSDMQLSQLAMFAAVARAKSYSAAARELYTSHSTLSRAVTALEDELGVALIVRDNRVQTLTPAGEVLLAESERLLALADEVTACVRAVAQADTAQEKEEEL